MPFAAAAVAVSAYGVYSSNQNAADALDASKDANASAAAIAQQQQDIANEQWQNYKTNYLPLEQDYLETAKNYGSVANQDKAATNAAAAAEGSFAAAKDSLNKTPGLDPNSQQYLREVNRLGITEAATSAASQTAARQGVADKGAAMLQDAASLGKGVSGNAVASLNAAAATSNGVASNAASAYNSAYNRAGSSTSSLGQMIGGMNSSGAFNGVKSWASGLFSTPSEGNNVSAYGASQPYMVDTNSYTPNYGAIA